MVQLRQRKTLPQDSEPGEDQRVADATDETQADVIVQDSKAEVPDDPIDAAPASEEQRVRQRQPDDVPVGTMRQFRSQSGQRRRYRKTPGGYQVVEGGEDWTKNPKGKKYRNVQRG